MPFAPPCHRHSDACLDSRAIPHRLAPDDLRHAFATDALPAGIPHIQQLLFGRKGHRGLAGARHTPPRQLASTLGRGALEVPEGRREA